MSSVQRTPSSGAAGRSDSSGDITRYPKLSEGVLCIRHEPNVSNDALPALARPLLLFCAGRSSNSSRASINPGTPARRLFWASQSFAEHGASIDGGEWSVSCAPICWIKSIRSGNSPLFRSVAPTVAGDSSCSIELSSGSAPDGGNTQTSNFLHLEFKSNDLLRAFLTRLRMVLKMERVTLTEDSAEAEVLEGSENDPEPDRPDAIHYVLSQLFVTAAEKSGFDLAALAARLSTPAATPSTPAPPLPSPEASPSSSPQKVLNFDEPAKPLLLQISLRCKHAFGLMNGPDGTIQPSSSGVPAAHLAVAAFERNPSSGRLSYLAHSEVVAAREGAAAGTFHTMFQKKFHLMFHRGSKQQVLLSLYDVGLGGEAEKSKSTEELHVHERSRIGTSVLLLDELMKSHPYLMNDPSMLNHSLSVPLLNYNNAIIASQLSSLGTAYQVDVQVIPDGIIPADATISVLSSPTAASSSSSSSSSAAPAAAAASSSGLSVAVESAPTPRRQASNTFKPWGAPASPSNANSGSKVVNGAPFSPSASSSNAAAAPASAASPASAGSATSPSPASASSTQQQPQPQRPARAERPEEMKFAEKLRFYEAVGSEPWIGSSSVQIALANNPDFVPTREWWEQTQEKARNDAANGVNSTSSSTAAAGGAPGGSGGSNSYGTPMKTAPNAASESSGQSSMPSGSPSSPSSGATSSAAGSASTGGAGGAGGAASALPSGPRAFLKFNAANLAPTISPLSPTGKALSSPTANSPPPSHLVVVFCQENPESDKFTFITHSEVVTKDPAPKFQTLFAMKYHAKTHRNVMVHIYDGARASSMLNQGGASQVGGAGFWSLSDDLLASFVMDMDDLASAAPGTQLVYAPQQVTDKFKLRYARAGILDGIPEPRIMVAFSQSPTGIAPPSTPTAKSSAPPPSVNTAAAGSPDANAITSPSSGSGASGEVNADDVGSSVSLIQRGSIFSVFRLVAPVDPMKSGPTTGVVWSATDAIPAETDEEGSGGADDSFHHESTSAIAPANRTTRLTSRNFFVDGPENSLSSLSGGGINPAQRRLYWSPAGQRQAHTRNSVLISQILGIVVGKHTAGFASGSEAASTPPSHCFTILCLYSPPNANPLAAAAAHENSSTSLLALVPLQLEVAAFSARVRSQWIQALSTMYSEACPERQLPLLRGQTDIPKMHEDWLDAQEQIREERRKKIDAIRAAKEAANKPAPPPPAAPLPPPPADDSDLEGISTDDSEDEREKAKQAAEEEARRKAALEKMKSEEAAAKAAAEAKAAADAKAAAEAKAAADKKAADRAAAMAKMRADAEAAAAAALALENMPKWIPQSAFQNSQPLLARTEEPTVTIGSQSFLETAFKPFPVADSLIIHIHLACQSLFGLDDSRQSDMVAAVFHGAQAPTSSGESGADFSKPAAPAGLGFNAGAAYKYSLLDNSSSVLNNLNPRWEKPFELVLPAHSTTAEQHLRINLYDAAGEGVTAKDQVGLVWVDLRPALAAAEQKTGLKKYSQHFVELQLMHPTNPALHERLAETGSKVRLRIGIKPQTGNVLDGPLQPFPDEVNANSPSATSPASPSSSSSTSASAAAAGAATTPAPPSPVSAFDGKFTLSDAQMSQISLSLLLSNTLKRITNNNWPAVDFKNAPHFPPRMTGELNIVCALTHVGQLVQPTADGSERVVTIALFERSVPVTEVGPANSPFLYKSSSVPSYYSATASGGAVKSEFRAHINADSGQILLLAIYLGTSAPVTPPNPAAAMACVALSLDELSKSSRALNLPLRHLFNANIDEKLRTNKATLTLQLEKILSTSAASPKTVPASPMTTPASPAGAPSAAATSAAMAMLAPLQSTMQKGTWVKRYNLPVSGGAFDNLTLFAREVQIDPSNDQSVETYYSLFWCPRTTPQGASAEVCVEVDGDFLPFFSITDLRLGRNGHASFAAAPASTNDGCFLVIQGVAESNDPAHDQKVELALEAVSQEVRDLFVLGIVGTGKIYAHKIHVHR